jgi:hypothetical protein
MTRRSITPLLPLLLAACTAHRTTSTEPHRVAHASPHPAPGRQPAVPGEPPPEYQAIQNEVMGWVVISDGVKLIRTLSTVVQGGHASAPGTDPGPEMTAKVMLARALGLDPHLAEAFDLGRPAAVAILSPRLLGGSGLPVLAEVPVAGRAQVEAALADGGTAVTRLPWGLAVPTARGPAFVSFPQAAGPAYALVAWREDLVRAAGRVLARPLAQRSEAPLVAHVDVGNLYRAYGREIEAGVARFGEVIEERNDPQVSFSMRGARRIAEFADSIQAIDVLVDVGVAGLTVTARADGALGGGWAAWVGAQRPAPRGPVWGASFIPRDAVLVYVTRRSPASTDAEITASVDYLGDASTPPAAPAARAALRTTIAQAGAAMAGEMVYAVWPGKGGGVGLGGAYRVLSPQTARAAAVAAYKRIGAHLGGVVARALALDPRFKLAVAVRERQLDGGSVDTVEVSVRWPKESAAERRLFEQLFGPTLVLATAWEGEAALFTVGRDWRERLAAMREAVRGKTSASLLADERFVRALDERAGERVSLTYLPMGEMASFIERLLRDGHSLDATQLEALQPILGATGGGAIVSATHATGARYELTTNLPASALPGLSKVGSVMWRMALSPLINPPTILPLPIPPAHVTPKFPGARARTTGASKTL